MVAPIDGSPSQILANDAVVPPAADEMIISWDFSGSYLIYLAEVGADRIESRVVDLTTADDDTPADVECAARGGDALDDGQAAPRRRAAGRASARAALAASASASCRRP